MKRCPECGRNYNDDSMSFCLDDGAELLFGPAGFDEPQTAVLHDALSGDEATRAQIYGASPTEILPSGVTTSASSKARLLLVPIVLSVIAIGGLFGYRYFSHVKQIESIAVMPFINESGNVDIEYLSDGMTETLIKSLSQVPNLAVKSRSTVFFYKGKETSPKKIGEDLDVQAVLIGRVGGRGDDLKLSLELVNARTEDVIWSEQYDRKQSDVVTLQSEIARDVSTKLKSKLSGEAETKVAKQATTDPEAYQAYLRGRYYWNKRTGETILKAIDQFQIAIDRDPNYALAFVGLADSYTILPNRTPNAPPDSQARAEAFARKAIALDEQLAEPHATLGNIYCSEWRWADAESEFKRALELNPNYPTAYHWYSILLLALGRNDEADAMIQRAHELDPMSSIITQNVAQSYLRKGDYKSTIELCQKIAELDPNFAGSYFVMAWAYLRAGRNDEAIPEFQRASQLQFTRTKTFGELGVVYAASGRPKEALAVIAEQEEQYRRKEVEGRDIALVYASLGEKDKAFEWLEKDFSSRTVSLPEIRWFVGWEPLRNDPRYKDLLRRMGLPE